MARLVVEWVDGNREPQCPPNPAFPQGIDVDASHKGGRTCTTPLLPYPAPRCGYFLVRCEDCGLTAVVTTAGRSDDPRSLKVSCRAAH